MLHPYYKLAYIKVAWGGPEEQASERAAGNRDAKDWQDEARKILEQTVSYMLHRYNGILILNRWDNTGLHARNVCQPKLPNQTHNQPPKGFIYPNSIDIVKC